MTQAVENILDAALALSSSERAELVSRLIRSLDGPEPTPAEQAEIDAAWREEIRHRRRDVEEGKTQVVPGEEVMKKLRARAAGQREEEISS